LRCSASFFQPVEHGTDEEARGRGCAYGPCRRLDDGLADAVAAGGRVYGRDEAVRVIDFPAADCRFQGLRRRAEFLDYAKIVRWQVGQGGLERVLAVGVLPTAALSLEGRRGEGSDVRVQAVSAWWLFRDNGREPSDLGGPVHGVRPARGGLDRPGPRQFA
jgi:hypothetical protein